MAKMLPASWSDIPLELADLVLCRLTTHVDRIRFAAVCPQWRLAAREVPLPPLLVLPDGTAYSLPGSEPVRFPAWTGYTDACGNWLAFSGEGGCFLRDPFSYDTVMLPDLFRVPRQQSIGETRIRWKKMEEAPEQVNMHKLLFCTPQLIAAFIVYKKSKSARVALCKPGASSWWSVHMDHRFPLFVDMAFHQGKLYVLDHLMGTLFVVDICVDHTTGDPWVSRVKRAIIGDAHLTAGILSPGNVIMKMLYLVKSHGGLMMVLRKMHCNWMKIPAAAGRGTLVPTGVNEFEVFRADFQRMQWAKLTTIGDDQVLFLRRHCSRSVSVSQNEMPGDRIVFFENDYEGHGRFDEESLDFCCVYDMKDGKVSPAPPMVSWKRGFVPATWLFPEY